MFFNYFSFFATFVWDCSRELFVIPFLGLPITWYGFLFALSFFGSYFLVRKLFEKSLSINHTQATFLTDQLSMAVVLGTVIGARLGHVLFYEWSYYSKHFFDIFKVWEGGLASHGGVVGILISLLIFSYMQRKKFPALNFLVAIEALVIPAAFTSGFIRIGNFINQEILGTPTHLPWGVIYLHPVQSVGKLALHPVQLYEALGYFLTGALLLFVWNKTGKKLGLGILSGLFFILVFGFRFFIEFIKLPQSHFDETSFLNMGQILSLPFILVGLGLLIYYKVCKCRTVSRQS